MIMTRCPAARDFVRQPGLRNMMLFAVATISVGLALTLNSTPADAKTPGSTYCFYGTCHRVKTLTETESIVGVKQIVQASFYDSCKNDRYNPCGLTSSGEAFRPEKADNAASPIYPDGTTLLVRSPVSQQAAVLRVNNAGPYWGKRTLDVSRGAAEALGFKGQGVAELEVRVLEAPTRDEATYKRHRSYAPVLGPIGRYASIDEAQVSLAVIAAFDDMPTTALVTDAASALNQIDQTALKFDVPETLVIADARPAKAVRTAAPKRLAAKTQRGISKRKHYAQRNSGRRSVAALRRNRNVASRYAQNRRPGVTQRVARSRTASKNRLASRNGKWRSKYTVTRGKRYRRVAEAHDLNRLGRGLAPIGGIRGIQLDQRREDATPRVVPPRNNAPVQFV